MSGVIDLTGDEGLEDDMDDVGEPAHGAGKRKVVEVGAKRGGLLNSCGFHVISIAALSRTMMTWMMT